jgi:hypothetical protein
MRIASGACLMQFSPDLHSFVHTPASGDSSTQESSSRQEQLLCYLIFLTYPLDYFLPFTVCVILLSSFLQSFVSFQPSVTPFIYLSFVVYLETTTKS